MPPKRFPGREEIAAVRAEAERLEPGAEAENACRLAGRVLARRDMGKLVFLDLVDLPRKVGASRLNFSRPLALDFAVGEAGQSPAPRPL